MAKRSREKARSLVADLISDMSDRQGYDFYECDGKTQTEWRQKWIDMVLKAMNEEV